MLSKMNVTRKDAKNYITEPGFFCFRDEVLLCPVLLVTHKSMIIKLLR